MKKKKKGFTLIELLAVIIVIAVVALIAFPLIGDSVKTAREKAVLNSIDGIENASLNYYVTHLNTPEEVGSDDNLFDVINYKGSRPSNGEIYVGENESVIFALEYGGKCYTKTDDTIQIIDTYSQCIVPKPTPEYCFTISGSSIIGYDFANDNCPVDVIIPAKISGVNVTSIGENAFKASWDATKKLNSVVIPNGVTSIGERAFMSNQLASVSLPDSLILIGYFSFSYNQLTNVTIPNNVTTIEGYAFIVNQLASVTIPSSITIIEEYVFGSNPITSVTIPNSVITIGNYAFAGTQLTSVTIPSSVTILGDSAFESNQLTSVTIPNSVTAIGSYAFRNNQLASIDIGSGISTIGDNAFYSNKIPQGSAIIRRASGTVTLGNVVFGANGPLSDTTITPTYIP